MITCDFATLSELDVELNLIKANKITWGNGAVQNNQNSARTFDLLFFLLNGRRHYVKKDGSEFDLTPGEIIFIPIGECYISQVIGGSSCGMYFDFTLTCAGEPVYISEPFRKFTGEKFERRFHAALENPRDRLRIRAELYRLVSDISLEAQTESLTDKQLRIRESVLEIERHPESMRSIPQLARDARMSLTAFNLYFRKYTGMSPVEYRNRVRCERADELLAGGEFSQTQIAEMLGFYDHSHLWRTLKKYHNKTKLPE